MWKGSMDLKAYYAENRRRYEIASREFDARTHGWRFRVSPIAAAWAAGRSVTVRSVVQLVTHADAIGMLVPPEPGQIRWAFSTRDRDTEVADGIGFGFWPDSAEYLVVFAARPIAYSELALMSGPELLTRVADSFIGARPRAEQAPANWISD